MTFLLAIFSFLICNATSYAADQYEGYFPTQKIDETHELHHVDRRVDAGTPDLVLKSMPYEFNVFESDDQDFFEDIISTHFDPMNSDNMFIRFDASLMKQTSSRQTLWMLQLDRKKVETTSILIAPRGNCAYLGLSTGEILVVDTATGAIVSTFSGICKGSCLAIELSQDESILAVGDAGGIISLVQPANGTPIAKWQAHSYPVRDIRMLQESHGNFLLSHDWFEMAVRNLDDQSDLRRVADTSVNDEKNIWIDTFDLIRSNSLALIGSGLKAKVIDIRNGDVVRNFGPTLDNILSLQVSEDESRIIAFSRDQLVYTWDVDSYELLGRGYARSPLFAQFINVAISKDGKSLALASMDPEISFPPKMFSRVRIYETPNH